MENKIHVWNHQPDNISLTWKVRPPIFHVAHRKTAKLLKIRPFRDDSPQSNHDSSVPKRGHNSLPIYTHIHTYIIYTHTLWQTNIVLETGPVEIVDLPIKNGGLFHSFVYVYQAGYRVFPSSASSEMCQQWFRQGTPEKAVKVRRCRWQRPAVDESPGKFRRFSNCKEMVYTWITVCTYICICICMYT